MNVLVDSSLFPAGLHKKSGHGRIWTNLFSRVPADVNLFCNSRIRGLPTEARSSLWSPPFPVLRPYRIGYKISDLISHSLAKIPGMDLLVPSHHVAQPSTLKLARSIPMVTILDDLIPETVPGTMPEWLESKRRTLEAAALVVCISESTKNLAMQHYAMPESKFRVAPLACDLHRPAAPVWSDARLGRYFLVVGNRAGYKNFSLTLQAFAEVASQFPNVRLLLAGPGLEQHEIDSIVKLGLSGRVESLGKVDDTKLAELYAGAIALVYPSLSEGFGIPALEAMTCGTVPIVSNCTSMPEVVGDAGLLIDPCNPSSLAEPMIRLMEDEDLRRNLVDAGLERSKRFSWGTTTRLIFDAWFEAASCG